MNILLIGGGIFSCLCGYIIKKRYPSYNVTIVEKDDDILKRVLVSGNGRCNFFNYNFLNKNKLENVFTNYEEYLKLYGDINVKSFLKFIKEDLNLAYIIDDQNRMYPFSNSAKTIKNIIVKRLKDVGVKILLNTNIDKIDYKNNCVFFNKSFIKYDKLILGIGGYAYDRIVNSNKNLFNDLDVKMDEISAGLCPLIVSKSIPLYLVGTRLKGNLILKRNRTEIYKEEGEILFKKDGISGICVFASSLFINLNDKASYYICFNPFKYGKYDYSFQGKKNIKDLEGIFNPEVYKYILSLKMEYLTMKDILDLFTFHIIKKYPLKDSQISLGGVNCSSINSNLTLKSNKDIYLGGEVISLHGICGGYNIGLSLLSAYKIGMEF